MEIIGLVQNKGGLFPPGGEGSVLETCPGGPFHVSGGDELIGVHVRAAQWRAGAPR